MNISTTTVSSDYLHTATVTYNANMTSTTVSEYQPAKAKIIFANGNEIEAKINGTAFIVDEPFKPTTKELSEVTVENGDYIRILHNVILQECASVDGKFWFSLNEIPEYDLTRMQMRSDIDYIALMAGIDLEVGE